MREGMAQRWLQLLPPIGYFAVCIPDDAGSRAKKDLEMGFWTFRPREKWSESNNQRREGRVRSFLLCSFPYIIIIIIIIIIIRVETHPKFCYH